MQKNIFVVFGILALCMVQSSNAMKCYQCSSLADPKCVRDDITRDTGVRMINCDTEPTPNSTLKYKTVTKCNKVVTTEGNRNITYRDCQFELENYTGAENCNEHFGGFAGKIVECKICTGSLCNAATSGRFLALGAIISMVSLYFVL